MKHTTTLTSSILIALLVTIGCRAIVGTAVVGTAVVVGTAGLAGYTVYKGGEAVVSTVGSVGASTKNTVQKKHKSVVVSRGTFKTQCDYSVEKLYPVAKRVLIDAGFKELKGKHDAMAAVIRGKTAFGDDVVVAFKLLEKDLSAVQVRIGEGHLKQSEYLYDLILTALDSGYAGGA